MNNGVVGIAGSRSLGSEVQGMVDRVVQSVVAAGRTVATGCAVGVDAMALQARLALPMMESTSWQALQVFAIGGREGDGFWRGSAVQQVQQAKALARSGGHGTMAPVAVHWWAGGKEEVPLRVRLARRTSAMAMAIATGSSGSGLVAFMNSPHSIGTRKTIDLVARGEKPIVVFPIGFKVEKLKMLGQGSWQVAGQGVWSRGYRWVAD